MKIFLILIFLVFLCTPLAAQVNHPAKSDTAKSLKPVDKWLAKDKADHFFVSAFLTGFGYYAAKKELHRSEPASQNLAFGFSFSLGVMKEIYDGTSKKGTPSWKDLLADVLGIAMAGLIMNASAH